MTMNALEVTTNLCQSQEQSSLNVKVECVSIGKFAYIIQETRRLWARNDAISHIVRKTKLFLFSETLYLQFIPALFLIKLSSIFT